MRGKPSFRKTFDDFIGLRHDVLNAHIRHCRRKTRKIQTAASGNSAPAIAGSKRAGFADSRCCVRSGTISHRACRSFGLLAALGILSRINFGCYAVMVIGLDFLRRLWLDGNSAGRIRPRNELTIVAAFTIPLITCCLGFCMWIYGSNIGVALSQFIVTAQRLMAVRGFIRLSFEPDLACAVALPSFWFFFRVLKGSEGFVLRQFLPLALGVCVLLLALAGGNHTMIAVIVTGLEVVLVVLLHVFIR